MSKGSGSTRGTSPSSRITRIYNALPRTIGNMSGIYGLGKDLKTIALKFMPMEDYEDAMELLRNHGEGDATQERADAELFKLLNDPDSNIGEALRTISDINVAAFNMWSKGTKARLQKDQQEEYERVTAWGPDIYGRTKEQIFAEVEKQGDYSGDIPIYRGGTRKNVESWTRDSRGANVGGGIRISTNMSSSVNQVKKDYYVFGIANVMGAPGEAEITLIRKRK